MTHQMPLISTIVVGLVLAFVLGAIAQRLRISPLVGYLLAGVAIGPATPGFVADVSLANELAEIGVILLMFGVGLHFSLKDLMAVKAISLPGAVAQIAVATILGMALGIALGWGIAAGLVFGLALSVASTVVLLRAMQERRLLDTERGRIAVGWLIVEDLATVLVLVMLPALAPILKGGLQNGADLQAILMPIALTIGKVAAFLALMLLIGRRVIPWILHYIAHTGSRELFRLSVLSIALGCAFAAATVFDVSFALGAFFAGMMMAESELSQRAAQETLPLRDAFAVLFFVSVGMLFDPMIVVQQPLPLLATLLIIMVGKSAASFALVRAFGYSQATALTISASLAQIGEFSFILAGLGVSLNLMPESGRALILAGAILSILLNPLCFAALDWWMARAPAAPSPGGTAEAAPAAPAEPAREPVPMTALTGHVVLIGYGRVGRFFVLNAGDTAAPLLIVEEDSDTVERMRQQGREVIAGNAADSEVIAACNLAAARCLLVAVPNAFEGSQAIAQARAINPGLPIVARAHSEEEVQYLLKHGATSVVMGEHEIARAMLGLVPPRAA
ncbi:sodium:proton antiporter [Pseudolabrys sp. Root1462]|uniref:YbaL family putative K(+) efflux transporter n=1 Tax=Pseudolabrys sp. Root1462 TaxID=1736466 RepID=UPI000703546F|nr:YbaL family putative K(+) efflux transporter [Pseudolabrys sp. Root1462]KQY97303.1 sodium:proton antiporter [Pseudolabrys sp. Root1462]